MQTQDASTEFLIKFWPWIEANRKRLVAMALAVVAVLLIWYFISTQRAQKAINAGRAYTTLQLNLPATSTAQQVAEAFLKLADQYSGTHGGGSGRSCRRPRCCLTPGATGMRRRSSKNFSMRTPAVPWRPRRGWAWRQAWKRKTNSMMAAKEYRAVTSSYPESTEALPAKFSLGARAGIAGQTDRGRQLLSGSDPFPVGGFTRPGSGPAAGANPDQTRGRQARRPSPNNETLHHRHRLCRPRHGNLLCRSWPPRHLRGQRRGQGKTASGRRHSDLRTRPGRTRQKERRRRPAQVHRQHRRGRAKIPT